MTDISHPQPEVIDPSRAKLRKLVDQLKSRYPSLMGYKLTLGYGIHPRDLALIHQGYLPSYGSAWRYITALIDAVPDPPSDADPIALFARALREAPRKPKEQDEHVPEVI